MNRRVKIMFGNDIESESYPSGCFFNSSRLVAFNHHKVGKKSNHYYSICYNVFGRPP